ncbi:Redoxin [Vararia minispora EC-137]|uniref:Redoxin n=1 Tax=Vararia minispora EC-137 TaxID=1314806 RepID=A0ACB8QHL0_9AGAM|nr:Redoxin [Vararia minispora EC-137]
MTSLVTSAAKAAHGLAASLLEKAQAKVGDKLPLTQTIKLAGAPDKPTTLGLTGRNVIVGVFGAFTPPCSGQAPGYIEKYEQFKAKGVENVYVLTVNDAFVTDAWAKSLAPAGTQVKFIADDQATFAGSLGLIADATDLVGGPRSKRFVIISNGDEIETLIIESETAKVTTTAADHVLTLL